MLAPPALGMRQQSSIPISMCLNLIQRIMHAVASILRQTCESGVQIKYGAEISNSDFRSFECFKFQIIYNASEFSESCLENKNGIKF